MNMHLGERTMSVDVFRGMTVAAMILVNNPGSWSHVYPPLRHAHWNGLMGADLVFPFFLFIMGLSVALSTNSRMAAGEVMSRTRAHVLRRAAILFLLGLFLNAFPFYPVERLLHLRVPGVLQRIALVYLFIALIALRRSVKLEAALLISILSGCCVLYVYMPVPGTGHPSLDPGTNLAAWLDRLLLDGHLWNVTGSWDPEGILSTVSAVSTGLIGLLSGRMCAGRSPGARGWRLLAAGVALLVAGLAWGTAYPLNKSLWSGSYALVTGGIACLTLAVPVYVIDLLALRLWAAPFVAFGTNALIAFILSSLLARTLNVVKVAAGTGDVSLGTYLYMNGFAPYMSAMNASLAWASCHVMLWLAVTWVMCRGKVFVSCRDAFFKKILSFTPFVRINSGHCLTREAVYVYIRG